MGRKHLKNKVYAYKTRIRIFKLWKITKYIIKQFCLLLINLQDKVYMKILKNLSIPIG